MKSIGLIALCVLLNLGSWAQTQTPGLVPLESIQLTSPETLKNFVPLLPEVKQHFWKLDPNTGYAVHSVGGGVYVMSDNGWQSAWLVTDDGVIVFDAPASFGKSIPYEIADCGDRTGGRFSQRAAGPRSAHSKRHVWIEKDGYFGWKKR